MIETSLAHPAHTVPELHHRVPRCLLRLYDRAASYGADFDGEGIELWFQFEWEAMRYGVHAGISRDELEELIEASTILIPRDEHRNVHESDFVRWGRRGGRETFRRYGRPWFALLARRRWGRITALELAAAFGGLS